MEALNFIVFVIFYLYLISTVSGEVDEKASVPKSPEQTKVLLYNEHEAREAKDYEKIWPFKPETFNAPNGPAVNMNNMPKPFSPFPFGRPKPSNGSNGSVTGSPPPSPPLPVWGWGDDKGGWTSMGWISVDPSGTTCPAPSTVITTVTATSLQVVTSTSVMTDPFGWTETEYVTSVAWETAVTTQEVTSTSTLYQTNVIEETFTETEVTTATETYTIINSQKPTTTITQYETLTSTTYETGSGWSGISSTESIVLEPSVYVDYTTSTVTLYVTETPTLTTHLVEESTITTGLEVIEETIYSPFSTGQDATVTEIIPTSSDITVGTVTTKISTKQPKCTVTEYEYTSTVTTPAFTHTATSCGIPCSPGGKCLSTCFPKSHTKYLDVTSTTVVTASQPIVIKYTGTETKTDYNLSPSVLYTTTTLESSEQAAHVTITASSTLQPVPILTQTVNIPISNLPTTLTIPENLGTVTIFETCTSTTSLEPTTLTLYETSLIEVDETLTRTTTSFTSAPIPTITSYVQGDIGTTTATVTEIVTTITDPTTTTIRSGIKTVGYGWTTITPTTTILRMKTATITNTPVLSTSYIKTHRLNVEELTTSVEGVTEYYHVTPVSTHVKIVPVTPTPSVVYEANLLITTSASPVGWISTTPSIGWISSTSSVAWINTAPSVGWISFPRPRNDLS